MAVTTGGPLFVTEVSLRRDPRGVPDGYPYSLSFDGEAPRQVEFSETELYQVTRAFLENPARMLREMMDEGEDA